MRRKKIKLDERPDIEILDTNNEIKKDKEVVIPQNFIPTKATRNKFGIKDGKVYEAISKDYGMFCDTGKVFKL